MRLSAIIMALLISGIGFGQESDSTSQDQGLLRSNQSEPRDNIQSHAPIQGYDIEGKSVILKKPRKEPLIDKYGIPFSLYAMDDTLQNLHSKLRMVDNYKASRWDDLIFGLRFLGPGLLGVALGDDYLISGIRADIFGVVCVIPGLYFTGKGIYGYYSSNTIFLKRAERKLLEYYGLKYK
jgi:hypothetical protein